MARHVGSKWKRTEALLGNSKLGKFVAPTEKLTEEALYLMLQRYGMVFVKPVIGMHGQGVMKVERLWGHDKPYVYQVGVIRKSFPTYPMLMDSLRSETGGKPYLVQRGISLLQYKGRPFDLRVMAQLTPNRKWETTGMIGRVARKGKIITNYHNGGTLMEVGKLLAPYATEAELVVFTRRLKELGVLAGKEMHKNFPKITEIGLDIGVSSDMEPWIIEVNTSPDFYVFRHLPDKNVFRKVRRYALASGRMKPHGSAKAAAPVRPARATKTAETAKRARAARAARAERTARAVQVAQPQPAEATPTPQVARTAQATRTPQAARTAQAPAVARKEARRTAKRL